MPNCGCFHEYDLTLVAPNEYQIRSAPEGLLDLKAVLDRANLADSISVHWTLLGNIWNLHSVTDEVQLRQLLDVLKSTLFVDLAPQIDECYALSPYTCFDDDGHSERTPKGEMLFQAKYRANAGAASDWGRTIGEFILAHPTVRGVDAVAAPPKSDPNTPDLPRLWSAGTASMLGISTINVTKVENTPPQKILNEDESEDEAVDRLAETMESGYIVSGASVLIIDDTIRNGATLKEVARALRRAGASRVYALAATKDARSTRGGVGLSKERWS